MNNYIKEKEILLEQSKNYLMALADIGAPPLLIMAILNIRERAATANAQEWKKEKYWEWWKGTRPEVYKQ